MLVSLDVRVASLAELNEQWHKLAAHRNPLAFGRDIEPRRVSGTTRWDVLWAVNQQTGTMAMWKKPEIYRSFIFAVSVAGMAAHAGAADITVTLREATDQGVGSPIGQVRLEDSAYGLLIKPDLEGLKPGPHGFHVHENADCGPVNRDGEMIPAGAAGGHYDPENMGRSDGPYGTGSLGDLPNLMAEQDGTVSIPTLAPRLEVQDVRGRSLVIHAGADRYGQGHASHHHGHASDRRVACGIIP